MRLAIVPGRFAVCRLEASAPVPERLGDGLVSVTRTPDELSIVCAEAVAPAGARTEVGWKCLAVEGPIPFAMTGVLASVLAPLAQARVSIFAVSTYDTDYVLVKEAQLDDALAALKEAGHTLRDG